MAGPSRPKATATILSAAAACVPGGPSIACSTPTAIRWDASFASNPDPSGRAVADVHKDPR